MIAWVKRLFTRRQTPPQLGTSVRPTLARVAKDLVDRARAGDQNAMAVLAEVGAAARDGNPKARFAHALVTAYATRTTPMTVGEQKPLATADTVLALQSDDTAKEAAYYLCKACHEGAGIAKVALIHGPPLTDARLETMAMTCFGREDQTKLFVAGVLKPHAPPVNDPAFTVGQVYGAARTWQRVAVGRDPLSTLDPDVALELGETS